MTSLLWVFIPCAREHFLLWIRLHAGPNKNIFCFIGQIVSLLCAFETFSCCRSDVIYRFVLYYIKQIWWHRCRLTAPGSAFQRGCLLGPTVSFIIPKWLVLVLFNLVRVRLTAIFDCLTDECTHGVDDAGWRGAVDSTTEREQEASLWTHRGTDCGNEAAFTCTNNKRVLPDHSSLNSPIASMQDQDWREKYNVIKYRNKKRIEFWGRF